MAIRLQVLCATLTAGTLMASMAMAQQPAPSGSPADLSAGEIARRVADGRLSSATVVQALVARAKEKASLNAIITLNEKAALERAATLDAEAKAGKLRGPLHGAPIVVKDNINSAGLRTTGGTPALENFVPTANAPVLQKLIDAGVVVLAKTNLHELAFGITSSRLSRPISA